MVVEGVRATGLDIQPLLGRASEVVLEQVSDQCKTTEMTSRKEPGLPFWATVVVVVALIPFQKSVVSGVPVEICTGRLLGSSTVVSGAKPNACRIVAAKSSGVTGESFT